MIHRGNSGTISSTVIYLVLNLNGLLMLLDLVRQNCFKLRAMLAWVETWVRQH